MDSLKKYEGKKLPQGNLTTERPTGAALPSPFKFHRSGKSGIEIPLERVNNVNFHQSVFERLLGLTSGWVANRFKWKRSRALAGELTVDYALKFKAQYGSDTTWIAGYSNDVFGYIPSLRVWKEGGYEGGEAFRFSMFPGRLAPDIEDRITAAVERVASRAGARPAPAGR